MCPLSVGLRKFVTGIRCDEAAARGDWIATLFVSLRLHGPWNAGEPGASAHAAAVPFVDRGEAPLHSVTSVEAPCAPRCRTPTAGSLDAPWRTCESRVGPSNPSIPASRTIPGAGTSRARRQEVGDDLGATRFSLFVRPGPSPTRKVDIVWPTRFYGVKTLNSDKIALDLKNVAEVVLSHLRSGEHMNVIVRIEIEATDSEAFNESCVRTVSENAGTLKFDQSGFEER
jgi:hypothetical protein